MLTSLDSDLSPWNPLSYLRLLGWYVMSAKQLRTQSGRGIRICGAWLSATLIWFPILTVIIGLQLGTIPRQASWVPVWVLGLLALCSWLFSGWLGRHDESVDRKRALGLWLAIAISTLTSTLTITATGSVVWLDILLEVAVGAAGIFGATLSGTWLGRLAAGQLAGFAVMAYRSENIAGTLVGGALFVVAAVIEENPHVNLPVVLRATLVATMGVVNVLLLWVVLVRG
jgi:hypothetical protein